MANSDGGRFTSDTDNTATPAPNLTHHYQNVSKKTTATAEILDHPPVKHTYSDYDHLDEEKVQLTTATNSKGVFSVYDHLEPPADSPYAVLGNIEEVDLTSFAYQIASGMVGHTETPHGSGNELYLDITDIPSKDVVHKTENMRSYELSCDLRSNIALYKRIR